MAQNPQCRSHPSATFTYAHGASAGRTGQVQEVERQGGLVGRPLPGPEGDGDPEAHHQVHLGQRGGELVAVALGQTSRHHQAGALVACGGQLEDGVDRFLARRLDEGARVDHDQIGVVRRCGRLVAVAAQRAHELVRVDLVLRTAQGLQPVSLGHQDNLPAERSTTRRGGLSRRATDTMSGEGGI